MEDLYKGHFSGDIGRKPDGLGLNREEEETVKAGLCEGKTRKGVFVGEDLGSKRGVLK